jgi:hypothetical protein
LQHHVKRWHSVGAKDGSEDFCASLVFLPYIHFASTLLYGCNHSHISIHESRTHPLEVVPIFAVQGSDLRIYSIHPRSFNGHDSAVALRCQRRSVGGISGSRSFRCNPVWPVSFRVRSVVPPTRSCNAASAVLADHAPQSTRRTKVPQVVRAAS